MTILVAGASGFVGTALLDELRSRPSPDGTPRLVRALVRREFDAVRLRDQGVEAVTGDLATGRGLEAAMRGVRTLVYLVHTLDVPGDVVGNDLEAVQNALLAARAAGVKRVIYLGNVGASPEARGQHLIARWATELAVRQGGLAWLVLRAPLIVGRGSLLFEMMRRTVDRSPVVPLFRWRGVEVEPVALGDVVEALRIAIDEPDMTGRVYDITGATRTSFGAIVRGWGHSRHRRRRIYLPIPIWGERFEEQLAWSLARLPRRETRLLLETLRERQVADPSRRFPLGRRPLTLEATLAAMRRRAAV
ncbi:MAG: NAD-dependent epimerase/dehydratase family protein [Dehalococcoidia bacterium]|nr:MAG: NAD-dependent epimerase/dehydratase family protein [Dehalococcoidia bacterium]